MSSLAQQTQITLLIFACLLLSGCHGSSSASEDYLQRLSRVLNVAIPEQSNAIVLTYPAQRDLTHQNNASNQISIREFLSLRGCELHTVIAHRNSLIGKLATPSQLLFNDLQILASGPACLEVLEQQQSKSLHKKLSGFLKHKQQKINANLWQAVLGERENAQFWHRQTQPASYPDALQQESLSSIKALYNFVQKAKNGKVDFSKAETDQIERHLQTLSFGDGGNLLHQLTTLSHNLDKANQMIQQRLDQALCLNGQATTQANYFKNVVNDFFIAKVQARAVALNRRYQQLMPAYLKLEHALSDASVKSYQLWEKKRNQQFATTLNASKQHVKLIQQLFHQCNITAG